MTNGYVCPNGHPVEWVTMIPCDAEGCMAQVAYEPTAHGMALHAAVQAHRDRWVESNGDRAGNMRPADRELWVAVLGPDAGGK